MQHDAVEEYQVDTEELILPIWRHLGIEGSHLPGHLSIRVGHVLLGEGCHAIPKGPPSMTGEFPKKQG